VMGSGIDMIYPAAHKDTVEKMIKSGGIVTENPFGTKPDAHNFPARNRIIAGLSDALVVVEAAESGGALITADIANSYNRDVFAYPGNVGRSYSEGCNNLIKSNKANLITSIKDLEYFMNWTAGKDNRIEEKDDSLSAYEPEEQIVLTILIENSGRLTIDELSWKSSIGVSQLASILLGLEFKGVISSLPGKVYKLAASF
jgi:DNA processing protein